MRLILLISLTLAACSSKPKPDFRVEWVEYLGGDRTYSFRISPHEVPVFQDWHRQGKCGPVYLVPPRP